MAALFAVTFSASNPLAAYGVFLPILADEFGWSRGALSSALTVNMVLGGFAGFALGALADRRGPKAPLALTCVLAGAGFALVSIVNALWELYLLVGVAAGIGMSGFYVLSIATAVRWFPAQRGLAVAIVLTGYSLGVMTGGPLAAVLIGHLGWRVAYAVLGTGLIVVGGIASLVVAFPPAAEITGTRTASALSGMDLREALRDPRLWLFAVSWLLQGSVLMMMSVHVVSYAKDSGLPLEVAAFALTAYGLGSVVGRMISGAAADRAGTVATMRVCYVIQIAGLAPLLLVSSPWALLGLVGAFGAGMLGADAVFSKAVADVFGLRAIGAIVGVLSLIWRLGAALGPAAAGFLRDATGSYAIPFGAAPLVVLASSVLFTIAVRRLESSAMR